MICTRYNQYPNRKYVEMCDSYGFDLNKATQEEIGQRAIELCDEFAAGYPEGSLENITFMALKANWAKENAARV